MAVCIAETTRAGQSYQSFIFTSEVVPSIELSVLWQFTEVREESYVDGIWEDCTIVPVQQAVAGVAETNERGEMARTSPQHEREGFEVDHDNEPLPVNVLTNGNVPHVNEGLYEGQSWGWDGID